MFTGIKDSLTSSAAKSMLASHLERYGKIVSLSIRSRERTIAAEILLEGEELPIGIQIERYRIIGKSGENALVVEAIAASRPWLQNILQDLLVDKPVSVPSIVLLALGKSEG